MIPYSLHVAILLAICLVFYKLLLQKETYYRLNRVVLLACLALAFVLPLVPVPQKFSLRAEDKPVLSQQIPIANEPNFTETPGQVIEPSSAKAITPIAVAVQRPTVVAKIKAAIPSVPLTERLLKWGLLLYWCVAAAFGANLLVQLAVLLYQAYKKPAIKDGIYRIVEMDTDKAPCSFGNNIFINPEKYDWETYNQILMHEKVHIQQGHSLDLLLAELMLVVQWFNPFAWLYRKELESNLEFLTDDEVLHQNEVAVADYQMSLLKVSVPNFSMRITTNYNQSLLKKRIVMMNAKRSNVHTMWKYFMLVPLLLVLVCGLNKPIAVSSPILAPQQGVANGTGTAEKRISIDFSHGTWFATIKADKVYIQFEADENDEHHNWSSSRNFNLSDFPNLPKDTKADFTLTREAGSVVFNGKFDGDQGIGHYKFTPNKDYIAYMTKENIGVTDDDEYFNYFMADVKKEYVTFLKNNGFKDISRGQVMMMSSQKIDAEYIKYWKDLGFANLTPNELVSLKSQKVDAEYVKDIQKAGYKDITVRQLISFHQQGITGDYINGLKKAIVKVDGKADAGSKPTPQDIMQAKAINTDGNFNSVNAIAGQGYLNDSEISSMKRLNITPEYIKSFEAVGYKDVPPNTLIAMKRDDITPEYVKGFKDLGYSDADISRLVQLKRQGITPDYVKSFASVGFTAIPAGTLMRLSSQKITAIDLKGYTTLNIKGDYKLIPLARGTDGQQAEFRAKQEIAGDGTSINTIIGLKEQGITPEYVKGFQAVGYKEITANNLRQFKSQGITPENIKALQDLGYKDVPVFTIKLVTPEYIKSMQDAGLKNVSIDQYANLKRQGVTPEMVTGYNKLGFTNISVNQYGYLKSMGITPEFITEMKQKGFDSKDINKYIQLKNFNADANDARGTGTKKQVINAQGGAK